jgi:hypothetical protein
MTQLTPVSRTNAAASGLRVSQVVMIVVATMVVTVAATFWFVRSYIYAADFKPVELDRSEQQQLDHKLRVLGYEPGGRDSSPGNSTGRDSDEQWLRPQRYTEDEALRRVQFSERELNAVIANNRDLARKLAVDLSDDLISARLLVPLDADFPILGGKTLRVSAGVEMAFAYGRPRVILKGVSLMGIPIPGAWLGGLKNIDLISEFGDAGGFWQGFAEGVDNIHVRDGMLQVELKP